MSCRNKRGCGCHRYGAVNVAPPCDCNEHEECVGVKCSEVFNADCVILKRKGCTFSIDRGATWVDELSVADVLLAISDGVFLTKCE